MKKISIPRTYIISKANRCLPNGLRDYVFDYVSDALGIKDRSFLNGYVSKEHPLYETFSTRHGNLLWEEGETFAFYDVNGEKWEAVPEYFPKSVEEIRAHMNRCVRKRCENNDKFSQYKIIPAEYRPTENTRVLFPEIVDYNFWIEQAKRIAFRQAIKRFELSDEEIRSLGSGYGSSDSLVLSYRKVRKNQKFWGVFQESGLDLETFVEFSRCFVAGKDCSYPYSLVQFVREIEREMNLPLEMPPLQVPKIKTATILSRYWDGEYCWKPIAQKVPIEKIGKYIEKFSELNPFILELMTARL